jgi:hypothetical protein
MRACGRRLRLRMSLSEDFLEVWLHDGSHCALHEDWLHDDAHYVSAVWVPTNGGISDSGTSKSWRYQRAKRYAIP